MNRRHLLAASLVLTSSHVFCGSERPSPRRYERIKREREEKSRVGEGAARDAKQPNRRESVSERKEAERSQEAIRTAERQARAKELAAQNKDAKDAGLKARQDGQVSGAKDVNSDSKRPAHTPGPTKPAGGTPAKARSPG